jgi:hypothetical protein
MKKIGTLLAILLVIQSTAVFAQTALTEATYAGTGGPVGADTDECFCKEYGDVNNPNGLTAATDGARKAATFQALGTGTGTVALPQNTGTGAQ